MENPRIIKRLFIIIFVAFLLVAIAICCYLRNWHALLVLLVTVLLFYPVCQLFAFVNILIFSQLFRIISKLGMLIERKEPNDRNQKRK